MIPELNRTYVELKFQKIKLNTKLTIQLNRTYVELKSVCVWFC